MEVFFVGKTKSGMFLSIIEIHDVIGGFNVRVRFLDRSLQWMLVTVIAIHCYMHPLCLKPFKDLGLDFQRVKKLAFERAPCALCELRC